MQTPLTESKGRNCFVPMDVHSHENIDNTEWWLRLCIKHNKSPWAQGVSLTGKIFGSGYLKKKIKKKNKHSTLWSPRKALRVSNSNPLRKTVQWEDMRSDVQEWHKFCPWNPMESWEKSQLKISNISHLT